MTSFFAKAVLSGLALSTTALWALPAAAHNIATRHRHWEPQKISLDLSESQIVTPFCEGKYEGVAKDLNRQNILGNVNLYRARSGLPPLQNQSYTSSVHDYGQHSRRETRHRDSTLLLERAQSHLSPAAELDYLRVLDLSTTTGRSVDWWLQEVKLETDEFGRECFEYLPTPSSAPQMNCNTYPIKTSKSNTAFDWLMTTHQMEKARVNWMGSGKVSQDDIGAVFDHIDSQAAMRPGINIWMTQYANHTLFERAVPDGVVQKANDAIANILSCQASPADYGIIAAGDLGLPHSFLPKILAEQRTRRDIHTLTFKAMRDGSGLDLSYHAQLQSKVDRLEDKPWASPFLFLSAPNLESALRVHRETDEIETLQLKSGKYSFEHDSLENLFFSLPTEDIPDAFGPMRLAHALSEGKIDLGNGVAAEVHAQALAALEKDLLSARKTVERHEGVSSSYRTGRYLALWKNNVAKLEKRMAGYPLEDIQNAEIPDALKLSLIAIFSEASHNRDSHHRDIYAEQSNSDFLDIYFRRRLFPGTAYRWAWRFRSYTSISEAYLRGENAQGVAFELPSLRRNDGTPESGLAAIIDWDKLERFNGEQRLTRTLATQLFNWVDTASPSQRAKYADLIAPAFYDLIRICRHQDAGQYNGAPVQQRAFERLHKYFGKTDSAKKTPYWWPSRRKHGNAAL